MDGTEVENFAIGVVKGSVFRSGTYMHARAQANNQCKHLAYRKLCYLTLLYGRFSLGLYVLLPRYFRRVLCLPKKKLNNGFMNLK